jgi:3-methylcrotonyl-CoA carboxylase alpha subunit
MGLKDAAKQLMQDAGVPVTPGYLGANQDPAHLAQEAAKIGYPVLIKAVAGGGGKGMRLVEAAGDFADALQSCQREAASSFGNDHVLIEKYIQRPRHIEVQVFGDSHGNVVHLFERDCSLQRRHQKVIEEAPAPGMDETTRAELCAAAVRAAKAVDYEGAGTIEFIADASEGLRADRIWFMEMNTRLQVEHPVTEEITGADLVEWQLRVAAGEALPKRQDELGINGWAMEARLYAEDPAKGFLPSPGAVDSIWLNSEARIETAVEDGDLVSSNYDPMIAKIITHGETRNDARESLLHALDSSHVLPITTNKAFLFECLSLEAFVVGDVDTGLIARNEDALTAVMQISQNALSCAAQIFRMNDHTAYFGRSVVEDGASVFPLYGFRLNADRRRTTKLYVENSSYEVSAFGSETSIYVNPISESDAAVVERGRTFLVSTRPILGARAITAHDGDILSPMPGKIIAVEVAAGQAVTKGQKLLTLEAMKMEHSLVAPFDGTVAELNAEAGAQVQVEALLARIEAAE